VQHAMKYAHSTDLASIMRVWMGDDHRANAEAGVLPYLKELLATKDFVVPHMLLTLPPVLYDENMQVEKVLGVNKRMIERFRAVGNVPMKAYGMLGADLAAAMELAGLNYQAASASSPFNDTPHAMQGELCYVHELPRNRSLKAECQALWPDTWQLMLDIALWMNDESEDWADLTRRPDEQQKRQPAHAQARTFC